MQNLTVFWGRVVVMNLGRWMGPNYKRPCKSSFKEFGEVGWVWWVIEDLAVESDTTRFVRKRTLEAVWGNLLRVMD